MSLGFQLAFSVFRAEGKAYTSSQFRRYVATALGKRRVVPVKIPVWLLWVVSVIAEKGAIVLGKTSTLNRDKFRNNETTQLDLRYFRTLKTSSVFLRNTAWNEA